MKKFLIFSLLAVLSAQNVFALKIAEIQFDPAGTDTDREWVEVFNNGSISIDFSKYKFFEANVNHSLTALSNPLLEAGEYAVVIQDATKFFADYPNFTGKAFTSSFSLSNAGEVLAFKNSSGSTQDSYTYNPGTTGAGDGLSEQYVDGTWQKGTPSPGLANQASQTQTNTSTSTNTTATTTTSTTTSTATPTVVIATVTATVTEIVEVPKIVYIQKSYWPANEKIYASAGPNKLTVTGAEVQFEGRVYDPETKQQFNTGDFHWSFGDGYSMDGSRSAKHIYKFPGEYTAVFQASSLGRYEEDRLYVKVVNPEIALRMGSEKDLDFIEITNNYNEELKLDDSLLTQLDQNGLIIKRFALPKGFSILPKRSIKIDLQLTQFAGQVAAVGLIYSSGIQLAKIENPNFKKDLDTMPSNNPNSSLDTVSVFLPGQEPTYNTSSTTLTAPVSETFVLPTSNREKKVAVSKYKTNFTNKNYIFTTSKTIPAESQVMNKASNTKVILSKPEAGFWQSVKNLFGI